MDYQPDRDGRGLWQSSWSWRSTHAKTYVVHTYCRSGSLCTTSVSTCQDLVFKTHFIKGKSTLILFVFVFCMLQTVSFSPPQDPKHAHRPCNFSAIWKRLPRANGQKRPGAGRKSSCFVESPLDMLHIAAQLTFRHSWQQNWCSEIICPKNNVASNLRISWK